MAISVFPEDNVARFSGAIKSVDIKKLSDSRMAIYLLTGNENTAATGSLLLDFNENSAAFKYFDGSAWQTLKSW